MKPFKPDERRLHPRVDSTLPLKVAANGFDFSTTTQNISCLGAYCHIDKYVPPFTRVFIKLALPVANKSGGDLPVECNGVIVRTEDASDGGFNIAIFFNRIKDDQRKKITQYINRFLPQETAHLA
ncbi:MAG: PilZ domain-containing protein [Candidatus Omnitrophica bacterium]|nr:PilZ domain-containing protein [Candidatus Omnitrophota bacterium]